MMPTLRAEFKKLFTVRSTYGFVLLALVILGIYGLYGEGMKDSANLVGHPREGALFIGGTITQVAGFISLFGAIIALLLITHEYRHNTITYTLTASNSRSKVLLAKILAVMGFIFAYATLLTLYTIGMIFLGMAISHNVLAHQDINYLTYVGKSVFNAEGYALAALLFGVLIRNQVGAFAALFIVPNPVEGLLGLLLKTNSIYLPFMALQQVTQPPVVDAAHPAHENNLGYLSAPKGALVFLAYLVVAWAVAWYLFLRRDAT